MKRIILSVIISALGFGNTYSQTIVRNNYDTPIGDETIQQDRESANKFQFYGQSGFIETLLKSKDDQSSMGGSAKFEFGVIYNITPDVPLSFGFNYSNYSKYHSELYQSGYRYSTIKTENVGHSFRIPVKLGYRIVNTETIQITPQVGPYLDWEFIGYSKYNDNKTKYSDMDDYNAFTFGLSAGISITYNGFGIYGEYAWGLSDKFKKIKQNYWSAGFYIEM